MVYLRWDSDAWDVLKSELDRLKAESKANDGKFTQVVLPGCSGHWHVHPHGFKLGDGGPSISWVLERSGVRIGLRSQDGTEPHETLPSGVVIITGETLTPYADAKPLWDEVCGWFAELGATIVQAKLSRVDMCVDLAGESVVPLMQALQDGRVIRRSLRAEEVYEGHALHRSGRRPTGMYLGSKKSGVALCRIYDKALECRDLARRAWLIRERWGCDPDEAVRVEFQLRREFLTAKKCHNKAPHRPVIDTVEDYFKARADLAVYLCEKWLRFVDLGFNPDHTERAVNLPLWDKVISAFKAWTGDPDRRAYAPLKRDEVDIEDLMIQIRGCAESAAARMGIVVELPDDLTGFLLEEFDKVVRHDKAVMSRWVAKRLKHHAHSPEERQQLSSLVWAATARAASAVTEIEDYPI